MVRETMTTEVAEKKSARLTATLEDETGTVVAASQLATLTLTLYDESTDAVLNSRNAVSVKNANGGTIDESGALTMQLTPLDNALVDQTKRSEWHIALFQWTWGSPVREGGKEIAFKIYNIGKIP